jgi:alginate O-acetyltransferase complex protein AlgI
MLFNTFGFIFLFLPMALLAYWSTFRLFGPELSVAVLAGLSLVFYWFGEHTYPWLLPLSIALNYGFGRAIQTSEGARRYWFTMSGIASNLGALAYFKYLNFAFDQSAALGLVGPRTWNVILPIGVSFFSFTQIAYLVDCNLRKAEEKNAIPFATFVSFFPHLIAGPILHHKEMMPQFMKPRRDVLTNLYAGSAMFVIGLAKKVLIADFCAVPASDLFLMAAGGRVGFVTAWMAALAYSAQIYFDFSGYCDMALGISRMLGIELPINFNSPYKSLSIVEFWRRWHITLSRFLRDYLYIPLGGNRKGRLRRYINLCVTMILGGFWHGAGWTFIIWGMVHGFALALTQLWNGLRKFFALPRIPSPASWMGTMALVAAAWVPFRAPSVGVTLALWKSMIGLNGFAMPSTKPFTLLAERLHLSVDTVSFSGYANLGVIAALVMAVAAPNSQELLRNFDIGLDSPGYSALGSASAIKITSNWKWAVAIGVLAGFTLRTIGGYSEFIYFQF